MKLNHSNEAGPFIMSRKQEEGFEKFELNINWVCNNAKLVLRGRGVFGTLSIRVEVAFLWK